MSPRVAIQDVKDEAPYAHANQSFKQRNPSMKNSSAENFTKGGGFRNPAKGQGGTHYGSI